MKMLMKTRREEDEKMLKKLDVGDAPLDTIDLHNPAVPFFEKKIKELKLKKLKGLR